MVRTWVGSVATLVMAVAAVAHAGEAATTVARAFRQGETIRYESTSNVQVAGSSGRAVRVFKETVREVTPAGEARVAHDYEAGELDLMGDVQDLPASSAGTVVVNSRGRVVRFVQVGDGENIMSPEVAELLTRLSMPVLPSEPVVAGSEWVTDYPNPAARGQNFQVRTTFLGRERMEGRELLKLRQMGHAEHGEGGSIRSEVNYWLDPETGVAARYVVTFANIPTEHGPLDITTTFRRLPDA